MGDVGSDSRESTVGVASSTERHPGRYPPVCWLRQKIALWSSIDSPREVWPFPMNINIGYPPVTTLDIGHGVK